MKVAIVTPAVQDPERLFGAERHFLGMVNAFEQKVDTTWMPVPLSEATWEDVLQSYIRCYELDVSAYDLVVSTKTPTFMTQHPNHVCWLLHQMRVFYDRFDDEYGKLDTAQLTEKRRQQETIQLLDNLAFQGVRKIFTNGHETARRLKQYNGFDAEVLYPPVLSEGHYCSGQDYFLLPGRLHRWKRVDLVLRAMQHLKPDVPLLISGTGEDEPYFRELAKNDPRIAFLGFVTDQELLDLYANALAVLFVPKEEDFGYITIEAMLSHKPVIVCTDSGEPARLVQNGSSGFVVKPDPAEIAAAMSMLLADRKLARDMGEAAYQSAPSQSWDTIVERLLDGATSGRARSDVRSSGTSSLPRLWQTPRDPVRVLVTDNQVLEPAVGGGRVRPKEICKGLASCFSTEYIGAFDWRGPRATDDCPVPGWRCRVFALSDLHYGLSGRLQRWVKGGSVIDVSFSLLAHTSRGFLRALRKGVKQADVVVFSHPWCYPLSRRLLKGKVVIYDSQNFEWELRRELLSATPVGRLLARYVRHVEGEVVRRSDEIWVCSNEDAQGMSRRYGVPRERFRLIPNASDTNAVKPAKPGEQTVAKRSMEWSHRPVVLFVGSGYRPNTESAAYIIEELVARFPHVLFAIVGGVKEDYLRSADVKALAHRFAPPRVPCCITNGWFEPEDGGAEDFVRWTAPEFCVEVLKPTSRIILHLRSPHHNHLTVKQGSVTLYDSEIPEGEDTITLDAASPGSLHFRLQRSYRTATDPRTLGIRVLSLNVREVSGEKKRIPLEKAGLESLLPPNVDLLGVIPQEQLYTVLRASDIALNPVMMGSGTNLKLLQYMAAGLPIISTQAGIRGIERGAEVCLVTERVLFADALDVLLKDSELRRGLGKLAREEAERSYDWTVVTERAAQGVTKSLKYRQRLEVPFFSVVVPTYNRPANLLKLLNSLAQQTFPDFEVVVVDQSDPPVEIPEQFCCQLRINYIHSAERGPAMARNKGCKTARGTVVAFTDDDCVPKPSWLEQAARYFDKAPIAGLEARVESEHVNDPNYRTVSNVGFEGVGFMTANMFYRRDLLLKVGGFDERFKLAFREDTDLAWRIIEYGEIPFARDSVVFHPPHPVNLQRESPVERAKMFCADVLLFAKHPHRYIDLIYREGHYRQTTGYWSNFARGITEYGIEPPLHLLFNGLSIADPAWWSAVHDGTIKTSYPYDADDIAALNVLLQRVTQKA
jgi:glycosyltransferase involved in cell wall biosynthesis/GT2 family glycosyltransferase